MLPLSAVSQERVGLGRGGLSGHRKDLGSPAGGDGKVRRV